MSLGYNGIFTMEGLIIMHNYSPSGSEIVGHEWREMESGRADPGDRETRNQVP